MLLPGAFLVCIAPAEHTIFDEGEGVALQAASLRVKEGLKEVLGRPVYFQGKAVGKQLLAHHARPGGGISGQLLPVEPFCPGPFEHTWASQHR